MSRTLRSTRLPPIPDGVITGQALRQILTDWQTLILAQLDIRDGDSEATGTLTDTLEPYTREDQAETISEPWTFQGAVTAASVSATGAVAGASVAASGALSGATATVTGLATAGSLALTAQTVSSSASAGGVGALPLTIKGYLRVPINGNDQKIPYYDI